MQMWRELSLPQLLFESWASFWFVHCTTAFTLKRRRKKSIFQMCAFVHSLFRHQQLAGGLGNGRRRMQRHDGDKVPEDLRKNRSHFA